MKHLVIISCAVIFLTPHFVLAVAPPNATTPAAETPYNLLAPLPLGNTGGPNTTQTTGTKYIPAIIQLAIGVAGVIAIIRIMWGGLKYMSSNAMTGKGDAKKAIADAVWGLLLVASSWLILNTINPALTKVSLSLTPLQSGPPITTDVGNVSNEPPVSTPILGGSNTFAAGCHDCNVISPEIPQKGVGSGCAAVNPLNQAPVTACLVNTALNDNLITLGTKLKDIGFTSSDWMVTEAYPPSLNPSDPSKPLHVSACHNPSDQAGGTCVDVKVNNPADQRVAAFLGVLVQNKFNFIYEVQSDARRNELLSRPDLKKYSDRICVTGTNGEHFHMGIVPISSCAE